MSIATTTIRYGWKIVAGVVLTGATIYTQNTLRWYILHRDIVPIFIGADERCMALQTSDGDFPVPRPSNVRTWTTTNGLTGINFAWVTQTATNTISWYTDHAAQVSLDATLFALAPYYRDPVTFQPLTVTGIFASLNLGNGVSNFTSIPAIGTNAAIFGPWAWRNYRTAWQERYKFLYALQCASNSYMMVSNQTIYVWWQAPQPPTLSPYWLGQYAGGGELHMSGTKEELEAEYASGWAAGGVSYEKPYSHYSISSEGPKYGYDYYNAVVFGYASMSAYHIGPFPADQEHGVIVRARTYQSADQWSDLGAIGAQNEWVEIINETHSYAEWHVSSTYGSLALALSPTSDPWSGTRGNSTELEYTAWLGSHPSHWTRNGDEMTNSVFGTNCIFYYCTDKYWEAP